MHGRVVVTGFNAWGQEKENPSGKIAAMLDGRVIRGFKVKGLTLPVSYRRVDKVVSSLLLEEEPAVVVHLGLAPASPAIAMERVALNVKASGPDADGYKPCGEPIVPDGPTAYFSTLPVKRILKVLRMAGIPAYESFHAGTFLCNYTLYLSLHTITVNRLPTLAGFIHVPYTPEQAAAKKRPTPSMCLHLLVQAVEIAVWETLALKRGA